MSVEYHHTFELCGSFDSLAGNGTSVGDRPDGDGIEPTER
jgi:hypothetical protein